MFAYGLLSVGLLLSLTLAGDTAISFWLTTTADRLMATMLVGSAGLMSVPFFLAGGLKIVYDLLLYRAFSSKGGVVAENKPPK